MISSKDVEPGTSKVTLPFTAPYLHGTSQLVRTIQRHRQTRLRTLKWRPARTPAAMASPPASARDGVEPRAPRRPPRPRPRPCCAQPPWLLPLPRPARPVRRDAPPRPGRGPLSALQSSPLEGGLRLSKVCLCSSRTPSSAPWHLGRDGGSSVAGAAAPPKPRTTRLASEPAGVPRKDREAPTHFLPSELSSCSRFLPLPYSGFGPDTTASPSHFLK